MGELTGWPALFEIARRHGGAIHARHATHVGLPASTFWRRVRVEQWRRLGTSVVVAPGATITPTTLHHAALLALGPAAALSHVTALRIHGLAETDPDRRVHVVVPHVSQVMAGMDVVRHRSRAMGPLDVVRVEGLVATTAARAIMDTAAGSPRWRVEARLLSARQRGLLTEREARRQQERRPQVAGAGRYRRALEVLAASDSDSILEHRTRRVLLDAGLEPTPAPHPVLAGGRTLVVDIAFPTHRLAIECDGYGFHSSRAAFSTDRRRWGLLRDAGWTVVWTTWQRTHDEPGGLVAEVRRLLAGDDGP